MSSVAPTAHDITVPVHPWNNLGIPIPHIATLSGSLPAPRPPQSLITMSPNPSPKAPIKLPTKVLPPVVIRHLPIYSPTSTDTVSQTHSLITSTTSVGVP